MFICQVTGKYSLEGEKLNKIVVETRVREYKNYDRENEEEWFSYGTEIVREINASDEGLAEWQRMTPEQQRNFAEALKSL